MKLAFNQLEKELRQLPGWEHFDGSIQKHFQFGSFIGAIEFVNSIASLAEQTDHHPDIDIRYSKVIVRLSTHSEGGITQKDIQMAKDIESRIK